MAPLGARTAADWPNGQDAARGHLDARARRVFSSHSRTILPLGSSIRMRWTETIVQKDSDEAPR